MLGNVRTNRVNIAHKRRNGHHLLMRTKQKRTIREIAEIIFQTFLFQTKLPFLVTTFGNEAATKNERFSKFNDKFCPARNHVENAIGVLKRKFPVLHFGLPFSNMELAAKAITVSLPSHSTVSCQKDRNGDFRLF